MWKLCIKRSIANSGVDAKLVAIDVVFALTMQGRISRRTNDHGARVENRVVVDGRGTGLASLRCPELPVPNLARIGFTIHLNMVTRELTSLRYF